MVSKALGAACGDRGLIQLVHLDVEGRVLKLLQNPNSTDVQDLQTVTRMLPDIEDRLTQGTRGEDEEVGLDLGELDKACENVALMIQYIESYEGFVRHCCEEIEREVLQGEGNRGEGGQGERGTCPTEDHAARGDRYGAFSGLGRGRGKAGLPWRAHCLWIESLIPLLFASSLFSSPPR